MRTNPRCVVSALLTLAIVGCGSDTNPNDGSSGNGKFGEASAAANSAAERAKWENRLHNVGVAFSNSASASGGRLPASIAYTGGEGEPLLSWRFAILTGLDAASIMREMKRDEAWDSPHNEPFIVRMPDDLRSPGVDEPGHTSLMVLVGPTTPFDPSKNRRPNLYGDLPDGPENTILAIYGPPGKAVPWTKPADLEFDRDDPLACLGEIPEEGVMVLMSNGDVRTLPKDISPDLFRNLVEPADGNDVELP